MWHVEVGISSVSILVCHNIKCMVLVYVTCKTMFCVICGIAVITLIILSIPINLAIPISMCVEYKFYFNEESMLLRHSEVTNPSVIILLRWYVVLGIDMLVYCYLVLCGYVIPATLGL